MRLRPAEPPAAVVSVLAKIDILPVEPPVARLDLRLRALVRYLDTSRALSCEGLQRLEPGPADQKASAS